MIPRVSLREALADINLLGNALAGESWTTWKTLLIAAMGEALTDEERSVFRKITQREHEPDRIVEELVAVIGRRGGKSRAISVLATYIAGLCKHPALVAGERGILLIIAPDQRQADIVLDYIEANFRNSPVLKQLVEARTQRTLKLTNNIDIEVRSSDFRRLRGPTYIAVIADESAFWLAENSSNPDSEILGAVRPGLATTRGPLFIISSPYARRGELWSLYNKHFGPNGDPLILVAQGASRIFNPSLPQSVVDRAMERDPASAAAEYGAEFRRDIESFVSIEVLRVCISTGVHERPPVRNVIHRGFCDPSGGSSDSMTLAIAHYETGRQTIMLDVLRETKPPFSPEAVVEEYSSLLKTYGISRVVGDKYAGIWPSEQFSRFNIRYEASARPKSDLYVDLLALLNSARIDLLDHPRLVNQLLGLERRTLRGTGRDVVDHIPHAHDDIANGVAGVAAVCSKYGGYHPWRGWVEDDDEEDPDGARAWRAMRLMQHIQRYG